MAALRKLAAADPNPGSVTQSSNTNNGGVTTDQVEVTAEYGTIPRFSVRNGAEWSIGMNEGNPEAMTGLNAPWKGAELSKKLSDGTLYVNAYTDIKAPTTRTEGASCGVGSTVSAGNPCTYQVGDQTFTLRIREGGSVCFSSTCAGRNIQILASNINGVPLTLVTTGSGNSRTISQLSDNLARSVAGTRTTVTSVTVPVGSQISISALSARTISLGGRFSGAGSFNGQQGSLRCSGSCRIEDGRATSGTWSFTPARPRGGTTTETDKDTDYLAGGIWLYVPDAASSTDDYEFGTFVDGNDPFTQANIMALTGTATYRGDATGVYSARAASATTIAYFDGDARLTADFGAAGSLGTISGSITNFEAGGESISGSLTLGQAAIGSANSGFFKGAVTGSYDERRYTGKWGGQFFGNGAASTDQPGSVAGTFGGRSTDNAVQYVGTFGAFKQ